MANEGEALRSRVRERREGANVRPAELARLAGISRQALHAIESGAAVPSTAVALRLARALACRVEDLFALSAPAVRARLVGPAAPGARVHLAELGGRLLALPLRGADAWRLAADGLVAADGAPPGDHPGDHEVDVELLAPRERFGRTALVAGCDPSFGLLAAHARAEGDARVVWRDLPSLEALRAVARGEAHAAGIHLWDRARRESNRPFVERELRAPATLFTLWTWEQGLVVAPGNPLALRGPADLARPGVRLANRAPGAGSRLLLDAWLDAAGLGTREREALPGYGSAHPTHLALAEAVRRGEADAGPGPRAAAVALGLDFVVVQRERFDLAVPHAHLDHPGVRALLAAARTPAVHAELAALGGYDPTHAAEVWLSL